MEPLTSYFQNTRYASFVVDRLVRGSTASSHIDLCERMKITQEHLKERHSQEFSTSSNQSVGHDGGSRGEYWQTWVSFLNLTSNNCVMGYSLLSRMPQKYYVPFIANGDRVIGGILRKKIYIYIHIRHIRRIEFLDNGQRSDRTRLDYRTVQPTRVGIYQR